MNVFVNGQAVEVVDGSTVADLVSSRGLKPDRIIAEVNGSVVQRGCLDSAVLGESDRIELVRFVNGG